VREFAIAVSAEGGGDESGSLLSKEGVRKGQGRDKEGGVAVGVERTEGGERGCLLLCKERAGFGGLGSGGC
jgi:hypothetical protein